MNSNGSKNPSSLSSNPLYGQSPTLSFNSLAEIVPSVHKKQRSDHTVKGQMGPKIQNKRAVSQNLAEVESCKRMRKDVDKSSDIFIPWSPLPNRGEWKMATQACITGNKLSTPNEKTPIINGCSRQDDSDMQGTFEHPKGQLKQVSLSIPKEVEMNNLDSPTRIIESESIKSRENAKNMFPELIEDNEFQNMERGLQFPEFDPNFENFNVVVNGLNINSDLGDEIRAKYFDLCSSQGSYLHVGILKIVDAKMAGVIISKVTEISEWSRKCNLASNLAGFEERMAMLKGFETFGMNLTFLITRLNTIYEVVLESTIKVDLETSKAAKIELLKTEEEKKNLELKLLEVEKELMRLQEIVQNATKYEVMMRKEATAPW